MCQILPRSLLSLPFQSIYAAVRSFPIFIVSMSFLCFGCSCSFHQGQAFLPLIAYPPVGQLFSASPAFSPLDPQRPSILVRPGSPQCCSSPFALPLCEVLSLLHFVIRRLLRPSSELQGLVCVACFHNSHCSFPLLLSIIIHRGNWMSVALMLQALEHLIIYCLQ